MITVKGICLIALLLGLVSCGGGSSNRTPAPTPTPTPTPAPTTGFVVSPGTATVALGAQQSFAATLNGSAVAVNWSVNGVAGGNTTVGKIDGNGNFTAPAAFPFSANQEIVTATLQSDGTKTATASVTIAFPNNNHLGQSAPVKLGTSGGNNNDFSAKFCCSGTLGSLVQRGGTFFILSNNHVLDKSDTGMPGDPIGQPGLVDNNCNSGTVVANLTQAAALKPSPCNGVCTGPAPSNVDAAIAKIVPGQVDTSGSILDLGAAGASSIAAAPPSSTLASPADVLSRNGGVAKSGRTSGLTCSNLQVIDASVQVDYSASCGGVTAFTAVFNNQIIINGGSFSAGGDSGSLIVTSDTARPLGLLFGGNSTTTSAHPIQDVLAAFSSGGNNATIVGGADHAVSCDPTASAAAASLGQGGSGAAPSTQEQQRVTAVKQRRSAELMQDPAITAVESGASEDAPGEGALVVRVSGATKNRVPPVMDGVRTKVVVMQQAGRAQAPVLSSGDIQQASAVKESHVSDLMGQPGIQGVGVGRSNDNPAETAIVIYVVTGQPRPSIPPVLDGVRTKIVEGERFRAFGWGHETRPAQKCKKK